MAELQFFGERTGPNLMLTVKTLKMAELVLTLLSRNSALLYAKLEA
jgi:hypothetical protein